MTSASRSALAARRLLTCIDLLFATGTFMLLSVRRWTCFYVLG
jgi:hypothetical protein